MSWKDICKKYSVVESCIRKWAKKYNLDRNKITSTYFTFSSNGRDMKIYKRELELMMCTMTWVDIGKKYSVNESCVRKWAKKYNLDRNKIRSRFLVSGSA
jgi:transposase